MGTGRSPVAGGHVELRRARLSEIGRGEAGRAEQHGDPCGLGVGDKPKVLVVDGTETVGDLAARAELAQAVAGAQAAGVAVLLGSTGFAATDLAPAGTPVLDVTPGERVGAGAHLATDTDVTEQEVRA